MALLVDERLEIITPEARTFRLLPWDYMPNNRMPNDPATGEAWFDEEEARVVRLSSKSHWDVPVRLPNGAVLHVLCSHPTPPAFDGPEPPQRPAEPRRGPLLGRLCRGRLYVVDDAGGPAGCPRTNFVILGDQNLDAADSPDIGNAMRDILLSSPRVSAAFTPSSDVPISTDRGPPRPDRHRILGQTRGLRDPVRHARGHRRRYLATHADRREPLSQRPLPGVAGCGSGQAVRGAGSARRRSGRLIP
ncbi:MAG: hypothetical protein R3B68_13790 [Phycisphaerales bacterium]